MLRKIEFKLDFLVEARDNIFHSKKRDELCQKEDKIHKDRREERLQKKKMQEFKIQEDRKIKNLERLQK